MGMFGDKSKLIDGFFTKYKKRIEDTTPVELIRLGWPFNFFKNPTEEMKLAAVKVNGCAIQYIENPTEEMKLLAIKENGYAIRYIKNPTEEMKLEAVKNNGWAIKYIEDPTDEMKQEADKQEKKLYRHLKVLFHNSYKKEKMMI